MDDSLLMCVLDSLAGGDKQFQSLTRAQLLPITVLRERNALDHSITK